MIHYIVPLCWVCRARISKGARMKLLHRFTVSIFAPNGIATDTAESIQLHISDRYFEELIEEMVSIDMHNKPISEHEGIEVIVA